MQDRQKQPTMPTRSSLLLGDISVMSVGKSLLQLVLVWEEGHLPTLRRADQCCGEPACSSMPATSQQRRRGLRPTADRETGRWDYQSHVPPLSSCLSLLFACINSSSGFSACASDSDLTLDTIGFFPLSVRGWWVFKHTRRDVSEQGWPSSASHHGSIPAGKPPWALESPAAHRRKAFAACLPAPTWVNAVPDAAHHHLRDKKRLTHLIAFANFPLSCIDLFAPVFSDPCPRKGFRDTLQRQQLMAGKSSQPQQAAFARLPSPLCALPEHACPRKRGDRDGQPKAGVSCQLWVLHIN